MKGALQRAARQVEAGTVLSTERSRELFGAVLAGDFAEEELAALLRGLAARGEAATEIAGAAAALREAMIPFEHGFPEAIDTCGTGGDGLGSFNLSTAAALVAAAAGARVIKHGNRHQSSRCGSADLLEAAGVSLAPSPAVAQRMLAELGIVYLHAPAFHPGLGAVAPLRRRLGIRTLFNFLGPLCNPGRVRRHLLGVAFAPRLEDLARALAALDSERAYVVHGAGGADELTLAGENRILRVGAVPPLPARSTALGLAAAPVEALRGGDAARNLELLVGLLAGEKGPLRDAVLYNAAAALLVAAVEEDAEAARERCAEALDSGAARRLLKRWAAFPLAPGKGEEAA